MAEITVSEAHRKLAPNNCPERIIEKALSIARDFAQLEQLIAALCWAYNEGKAKK